MVQRRVSFTTLVVVIAGLAGSVASAEQEPFSDLAITGLRVDPVPLRAGDVTLAHSPWVRDVTVEASNVGTIAAGLQSWLEVWVHMASDGSRQMLGYADLSQMPAGETMTKAFPWNGFGSVGDARVVGYVCGAYGERNARNDELWVRDYIVVAGTGFGYSPLNDTRVYPCDYFY